MASKTQIIVTVYNLRDNYYLDESDVYDRIDALQTQQQVAIVDHIQKEKIRLRDILDACLEKDDYDALEDLGFTQCDYCGGWTHEDADMSLSSLFWCERCDKSLCDSCECWDVDSEMTYCPDCYDQVQDEKEEEESGCRHRRAV